MKISKFLIILFRPNSLLVATMAHSLERSLRLLLALSNHLRSLLYQNRTRASFALSRIYLFHTLSDTILLHPLILTLTLTYFRVPGAPLAQLPCLSFTSHWVLKHHAETWQMHFIRFHWLAISGRVWSSTSLRMTSLLLTPRIHLVWLLLEASGVYLQMHSLTSFIVTDWVPLSNGSTISFLFVSYLPLLMHTISFVLSGHNVHCAVGGSTFVLAFFLFWRHSSGWTHGGI